MACPYRSDYSPSIDYRRASIEYWFDAYMNDLRRYINTPGMRMTPMPNEDELNEYREEQKRQDRMAKMAEDNGDQVDADEEELEPPKLNEDGSLADTEDEEDE